MRVKVMVRWNLTGILTQKVTGMGLEKNSGKYLETLMGYLTEIEMVKHLRKATMTDLRKMKERDWATGLKMEKDLEKHLNWEREKETATDSLMMMEIWKVRHLKTGKLTESLRDCETTTEKEMGIGSTKGREKD